MTKPIKPPKGYPLDWTVHKYAAYETHGVTLGVAWRYEVLAANGRRVSAGHRTALLPLLGFLVAAANATAKKPKPRYTVTTKGARTVVHRHGPAGYGGDPASEDAEGEVTTMKDFLDRAMALLVDAQPADMHESRQEDWLSKLKKLRAGVAMAFPPEPTPPPPLTLGDMRPGDRFEFEAGTLGPCICFETGGLCARGGSGNELSRVYASEKANVIYPWDRALRSPVRRLPASPTVDVEALMDAAKLLETFPEAKETT